MSILTLGMTAWRKYVTDGVPGSGPNPPDKTEIQAFVAAVGALEPVVDEVPALVTNVATLMTAQSGGHVGFATSAAMIAAVGSYAAGVVAECFDPDPTLAGLYIRQVSASWGTRVALLPEVAAQAAATAAATAASGAFDFALYSAIPTVGGVYGPVVLFRATQIDWIIRTLIVNGKPGEVCEWHVRDISAVTPGSGRLLVLASISTNENGIRRVQSDFFIHGSVFEYSMNVGLMTDSLGSGFWNFYGNGHGHVTQTGMGITMDAVSVEEVTGFSDIEMPIGSFVSGSSLVINQTFNIRLPKDDTTVIGNVSQQHTFDTNGCLFTAAHTITASGIGNQNSYSAMLPVSGCNMAQFGSNAAIAINLYDNSQSANQGHQSTLQAWHTDRPDLLVEMILPSGNPGSPDGYTNVTTSDTFTINDPAYSKLYVNYRSGTAAVAANNSSHATQYRVRKT